MSYGTKFKFTYVGGDALAISDFHLILREQSELPPDDLECGSYPWYEHEEHIKVAMSRSGVSGVDLHGVGEEEGDIWDKEFRWSAVGELVMVTYRYKLVRNAEPEKK